MREERKVSWTMRMRTPRIVVAKNKQEIEDYLAGGRNPNRAEGVNFWVAAGPQVNEAAAEAGASMRSDSHLGGIWT